MSARADDRTVQRAASPLGNSRVFADTDDAFKSVANDWRCLNKRAKTWNRLLYQMFNHGGVAVSDIVDFFDNLIMRHC